MLHHPSRSDALTGGGGGLSSIIKSISLDPKTAELASNLPNFSRFVRECLIRYHLEDGGEWALCKRKEGERLCYHGRNPRCMKCWPAGPPPAVDWATYVRAPDTHDPYGKPLGKYAQTVNPHYHDHGWIQARAEEHNPPLFSFKDMEIAGNAKPTRSKPKRGKLARLMGRLWPK